MSVDQKKTSHAGQLLRTRSKKVLWMIAGGIATILGLLGIPIPLLPTTPFLLIAAFCFGRSSKTLHGWLVNHKKLGPPIRNWQAYGAISRRAKCMAVVALLVTFGASFVLGIPTLILVTQAFTLSAVAVFILTRPSGPKRKMVNPDEASAPLSPPTD